jgi:hypothetical protein
MVGVRTRHESAIRVSIITADSHTATTTDTTVAGAAVTCPTTDRHSIPAAGDGIGPEARVALAEVHLGGGGVPAAGLELRGRGGDAVGAHLNAEVADALRHGLHVSRRAGAVRPVAGSGRRRRHERGERGVAHGDDARVRRALATALLEQHRGVLLPQERVVPVPHEAGAQLHRRAGRSVAERGELGRRRLDASAADCGGEVRPALVHGGQVRGGGRGRGVVGVGSVGGAVEERGQCRVHVCRVLRPRVVPRLRAPRVHKRRVVVAAKRRREERARKREDHWCEKLRHGLLLACFLYLDLQSFGKLPIEEGEERDAVKRVKECGVRRGWVQGFINGMLTWMDRRYSSVRFTLDRVFFFGVLGKSEVTRSGKPDVFCVPKMSYRDRGHCCPSFFLPYGYFSVYTWLLAIPLSSFGFRSCSMHTQLALVSSDS